MNTSCSGMMLSFFFQPLAIPCLLRSSPWTFIFQWITITGCASQSYSLHLSLKPLTELEEKNQVLVLQWLEQTGLYRGYSPPAAGWRFNSQPVTICCMSPPFSLPSFPVSLLMKATSYSLLFSFFSLLFLPHWDLHFWYSNSENKVQVLAKHLALLGSPDAAIHLHCKSNNKYYKG